MPKIGWLGLFPILASIMFMPNVVAAQTKDCDVWNSLSHFEESEVALERGNLGKARALLSRGVERHRHRPMCTDRLGLYLFALGRLEVQDGHYEEGIEALGGYLRIERRRLDEKAPGYDLRNPPYDAASYALAVAFAKTSRWSDAGVIVDAYFDSNPFAAEASLIIRFQEVRLAILYATAPGSDALEAALRDQIRYRNSRLVRFDDPEASRRSLAELHDLLAGHLVNDGRQSEALAEWDKAKALRKQDH